MGPPSAKAGGTLPTMRRHNTCQAKKHLPHRTEFATPRPKHIKNSRPIRRSPVSLWLPHTEKRDINDGLVAVEGTGEFAGKASRAETEHFSRRQMSDRGHAVLQFEDTRAYFLQAATHAVIPQERPLLTSIEIAKDFSLISKELPCILRLFLGGVFPVQSKQPFTDELRIRDVFPPVNLDVPADAVRGRHVGGPGTQALKGFAFTVTAQ